MSNFGQSNRKASKLSVSEVIEIRQLYAQGRLTQGELSRRFHVSIVQIGRIVRGEVWQSVESRENLLSEGEIKESAERMLALQERLKARKAPEENKPAAASSPLDGGDAPSAVDGSGLSAVQQRAAAYGLDIDKLLGEKK